MRTKRLWENLDKYGLDDGKSRRKEAFSTLAKGNKTAAHTVRLKTISSRGRKRAVWVDAVHFGLRDELDQLIQLGVKFNMKNLSLLVFNILKNLKVMFTMPRCSIHCQRFHCT